MFFGTENNQQRIPSQYVDFSCYEKFGILMMVILTHLYVSPAIERPHRIKSIFHRDYDDLGSFLIEENLWLKLLDVLYEALD